MAELADKLSAQKLLGEAQKTLEGESWEFAKARKLASVKGRLPGDKLGGRRRTRQGGGTGR